MTLFQSKYFQIEKLAEGVFAAIIHPGSGCIGNAAVVDLGGRTIIWDTFQNHRAALDLRQFAMNEFEEQPILVVNSHFHLDHCGGNQVFSDCAILSTSKTREVMEERNPGVVDFIKKNPDFPKEFAKKVELETDPMKKEEMLVQLKNYEEIGEMIIDLQFTLPNITFDHSLVLHGQKRTAHLNCYGGGHTPSDLVLYLPEDEILLIGDLITVCTHPMVKHGDIEEWLKILDILASMPIKQIFAGHGPAIGKEHLQIIQNYLSNLIQVANNAITDGTPLEELEKIPVPEDYSKWSLPELYTNNLKAVYTFFQSKLQPQK